MLKRASPVVRKTYNLCIGCVQGAGRAVKRPMERRYERHYHPRLRHGRKHLVADLAMAGGILTLIVFNAWLLIARPNLFSNVSLAWQAAPQVRVGDSLTLTLDVAFTGEDPLDRATIAFAFPEALTVTRVTPGSYDAQTHTLVLPTPLAPGASVAVTLAGAVAAPTDDGVLELLATFHGSGPSGTERQQSATTIAVRGIALTFDLEVPPVMPSHGEVGIVLHYRSEAALPLEVFVLPEVRDPLEMLTGDHWGLPRIVAPNTNGSIPLEVRTGAAGTFALRATVGFSENRGSIGGFTFPFVVVDVPVELSIASQGDGLVVARLGETTEIGVSYQGVRGEALPEGFARSLSVKIVGLLASTSYVRASDAEIGTHPVLLQWPFVPVPSGERVGHTFTMTPPEHVDVARYNVDSDVAYRMTSELLLWQAEGGRGIPYAKVVSTPLVLDVASDLRLTTFARYYTPEGDQLGRGPLPPRVGETTRYWVTWDVQAALRDAGRTVVRATLPPGVEWTNRTVAVAGERVTYDVATRTVLWVVDRVPRTIGAERPATSASFEVALTPDGGMIGQPAMLLGRSIAETSDDMGAAGDTAATPPVTTDLIFDQRARGKGIVAP
ncbi:MAG: hypothetical protein Q7T01_00175 [bacterium]|nr:hypothetical protein [bacterium]